MGWQGREALCSLGEPETSLPPTLKNEHNGAKQTRFAQHLCCTQHLAPWDPTTDSIEFGDDFHYGGPISRWSFQPILKAHIPDFKIAAYKPAGWISGAEADEKVREHERKMATGTLAGAL